MTAPIPWPHGPVFIGLPAPALRQAGLAAILTVLVGLFVGQLGRPLLRDLELEESGVLAPQSEATVRCSGLPVLQFCDVAARYVAAGTEHRQTIHMLTFWTHPAVGPFRVRYDPQAPGRIATSWGAAAADNRARVLVAVMVGYGAVMWFNRRRMAELWRAFRLRRVPLRPVVAAVEDIRRAGGPVTFRLAWDGPDGPRRAWAPFPAGAVPFWMDASCGHVAALAGADGQAVALDAGLQVVALSDADRAALLAALQRGSA